MIRKTFFEKSILAGIIGVLLITGLTNCSGEKPPSTQVIINSRDSVDINYWTVFTGPDGRYMQEIVKTFNDTNRGKVEVNMKVFFADEYYSRLIPAAASGTAPDIGVMHTARIYEFASRGILTPLDEFASKGGYSENDYPKAVWNASVMEGKRYGMPLDIHPLGLYYNVDLLHEAGFLGPPETMDDFLKIAQACTKDLDGNGQPDQWGYATTKMMNANIFMSFLYQFGGKMVSADGAGPGYETPEGVKTLQFMSDLVHKYKVCPSNLSPDEDIVMFKQNKLALYIQGIWVLSEFREQKSLNFEVAPIPQFGERKAVWADSHNLIVFKQRKSYPDKIEAAEAFMEYLLGQGLEWSKAGQLPPRNDVRKSAEFLKMKDQSAFALQEEDLVFPVPSVNYDAIWSPLDEQIKNILAGISGPEEAIAAASANAMKNIKAKQ